MKMDFLIDYNRTSKFLMFHKYFLQIQEQSFILSRETISYLGKLYNNLVVKLVFIEYAFLLVKDDECDSDAENEQNHDPNVEEFLQQQDTAVIYPEAPEEDQRQGTPEASGHDENGNKLHGRFVLISKGLLLPLLYVGTHSTRGNIFENQNLLQVAVERDLFNQWNIVHGNSIALYQWPLVYSV